MIKFYDGDNSGKMFSAKPNAGQKYIFSVDPLPNCPNDDGGDAAAA